jgi:uncharacterized protein
MLAAHPGRRAVALSSFDLPDAQRLLVHGCEDCAPVSTEPVVPAAPLVPLADSTRWIRGQEIFESQLDTGHRLLFNPLGNGGVVVVNELAHRIFSCFGQPVTLADVQAALADRRDGVEAIVTRLRRLDIIHPVGQPVRPVFQSPQVLTAWLHVSNACNLRCPYCYVNKSAAGMNEHTGRAAVAAVIRSAVDHGFPAVKLKYAGGEASLNSRLLVRLHEHARMLTARHGLALHGTLLSNGVKLPRPLVETLKAENIRVMISLDGVGGYHDAQRPFVNGKPSFAFVERSIAQLISQDHAPHLSITITNRNAGGVADVVRFALDRDLTFSLNFFRDNDCAVNFPDLRYEKQAMISALLDAFAVIEEHLPPWSVLGSILDRGQLLQPRQRPCGVGQDYVVIDHQGKVAKCHMEIERTLGDVFHDDPLRLVRRDTTTVLNLLVDEKEGCRDCTWRHWCSGGCSVATFRATGRFDIKSPNCAIYKAIYPQALRLEGMRLLKYAGGATGAPVAGELGAAPE